MNQKLKQELLDMVEEDNRVRAELVASGELFEGYNSRMADVHQRNAQHLDAIIEQHGWPGNSLAGEDAADAAWLVLQHAIGNPALQRRCLPLLIESAELGEIKAFQMAYLEDRIGVFEGRTQRYGTQFDWDVNGVLSPHPIQDPKRVDHYRESVGLGTLSKKTQEMRLRAAAEGDEQPRDFHQRQKEKEAWARSVGWR